MAQRRMFSKTITNSSQFLMMPSSSQNLYFHIGMNADDDGFCEHFSIMRMTDSKPDDLKILQAKGYVNLFDDKVLIILDWKENNYLRSDRYTASKYLAIYKEELLRLDSGIPVVDTLATQDRIGKVRKGKDTNTSKELAKDEPLRVEPFNREIGEVIKAFEEVDPKNKSYYGNKTQRSAAKFLIETYGEELTLKVIDSLPKTNTFPFFPIITTPFQLKENWTKLQSKIEAWKNQKQLEKNKYQVI